MTYKSLFSTTVLLSALLVSAWATSRAEPAPVATPDTLANFERLIGGQWHLEDSYQEFEWGVGRRSVKARSYFVIEGRPKLVSEGIWFWHPGEGKIKGLFTAIDMPVELFEYTTRFEGNSMVSDLVAYPADGEALRYTEKWVFVDDAKFEWTLFVNTPQGPKKEMGGTYSRKQ